MTEALAKHNLLVEVIPEVEEAVLITLARADPAMLKENGRVFVMVPVPKALLEDCVSDTITLEDAKTRLPSTLGYWLKTVENIQDQAILDDNGEIIFDSEGQGLVFFRFEFKIPTYLFEDF